MLRLLAGMRISTMLFQLTSYLYNRNLYKYAISHTHLKGDPIGVAMPNPFVSRLRPTFIVSQGSLAFTYSFFGDSISRAYLPFDVRTRRMPSSYVPTKTCFREFIYSHILLCKPIWDRWNTQTKQHNKWFTYIINLYVHISIVIHYKYIICKNILVYVCTII